MSIRVALGQLRDLDDETAAFGRQLGLKGIQYNTPNIEDSGGYWSFSALEGLKKSSNEQGFHLEAIENVPLSFYADIMNGGPRSDEQLELMAKTIKNIGAAGIGVLGYHFMPTSVWRTSQDDRGRGGAIVTGFDLQDVPRGQVNYPRIPIDVPLSHDNLWSHYEIYLNALLPVAESSGVRLALHPDDPPLTKLGVSARLFDSVDSFKKAEKMSGQSPAWSLDLCIGSVSEMPGGAESVTQMIDWFGPSGKIAYCHFRQVVGTIPAFEECFLGEGNFDPVDVMSQLHRVGFDGFLLDDHVPGISGDTEWGHRSRAYAIGYLQALVRAVTGT